VNMRIFNTLIIVVVIIGAIASSLSGQCDTTLVNKAFGPGEYFEFGVYLAFLHAGTATLEVDDIVEVRDNLCYHIKSTARSNATVSVLYQVNDLVESFIDVERLYSHRFEKHLSEGNYSADKTVSFDQEAQLAYYSKDTLQIMECTHDAL